jgi:hypothetical protein
MEINLHLTETLCICNQASGQGLTVSLGLISHVAQFNQGVPNCGSSIDGSKGIAHLLDRDNHANIFAALGSKNETKLLAVLETFNNSLGTHYLLRFVYNTSIILPNRFCVN